MKIAVFVSPYDTVPPKSSSIVAPWQLAGSLVEGLKAKHQVTLYCAEGSSVPVDTVTLGISPDFGDKGSMSPFKFTEYSVLREQRLGLELVRKANAGAYDLIHVFHGTLRLLPVMSFARVPVVATLHDPLTDDSHEMYRAYRDVSSVAFVALSESQERMARVDGLNIAGVVSNGVDPTAFTVNTDSGTYLLMTGRIRPEKGISDGIAVAKQLGERLIIAGENYPNNPRLWEYWEHEVKPHLDSNIIYDGFLHGDSLRERYAGAKALLFPVKWEEPFGLVMIEAMASGTPVIAYNRGSVSEIVRDGVTGFIVEPDLPNFPDHPDLIIKKKGIEGLVEAVKRIGEIDRAACRKHVEEHFTVERMISGYERIYSSMIESQGSDPKGPTLRSE